MTACGLISASIDHRKTKEIRPVCIVATGTTYTCLYNLVKSLHLIDTLKIEFVSTVELALQRLKERIGARAL